MAMIKRNRRGAPRPRTDINDAGRGRPFWEEVASLSGTGVAERFKCGFSGDGDPINHGGFFYDFRDWEEYGYASCVEFWWDHNHDRLVVERGVINKPEDDELRKAMRSNFGAEFTEFDNIHAQIDMTKSHWGAEPDDTDYPASMAFNEGQWPEWRIWRAVSPWLDALGA